MLDAPEHAFENARLPCGLFLCIVIDNRTLHQNDPAEILSFVENAKRQRLRTPPRAPHACDIGISEFE